MKTILKTMIIILIIFSIKQVSAANKNQSKTDQKLYLKIYLKEAAPEDTIFLCIDNIVNLALSKYQSAIPSSNKGGYFEFEVPLKQKIGYFTLIKTRTFTDNGKKLFRKLISPNLYEAGDSLVIHLSSPETMTGTAYQASFEGKGSLKYQIKEKISSQKVNQEKKPKVPPYPFGFKGNIMEFKGFDAISDYTQDRLDTLSKHKTYLSELIYNTMKADIIYENQHAILKIIEKYAKDSLAFKSKRFQRDFRKKYELVYDAADNYIISKLGLTNSMEYNIFLFIKHRVAGAVYTGARSVDWSYQRLKQYPGGTKEDQMLKDNSMLFLFLYSERAPINASAIYQDAISQVKNPEYIKVIQQLKQRTPGNDLSGFELTDLNGDKVKLGKFKGKVTLIDFWFTNCGHCEFFYKNTLSKVEQLFKGNEEVNFISISSDVSVEKWKESILSGVYTSNDAINLYTGGKGMHHEIVTENLIYGFPCVLIMDKDGRLLIFNTPDLYKFDTLVQALKKQI